MVPTTSGLIFATIFHIFLLNVLPSFEAQDVSQTLSADTPWCLTCICMSVSECNVSEAHCNDDVCGIFHITRPYWIDGGKQVIEGDNANSHRAFAKCANNEECARRTVASYFRRYAKDCNGDGRIDCLDYAAIHMFGPGGCTNSLQTSEYFERLKICIIFGQDDIVTTEENHDKIIFNE